MAAALSFDEINKVNMAVPSERKHSIPYNDYFGAMQLSDEAKEARISLAEALEDNFLYILMLLLTMQQYGVQKWEEVQEQLETIIMATVAGYASADDYVSKYAAKLSGDIISSTRRHKKDPYYYSADRAAYIAENEANTFLNYSDYMQAILSGKTKKRWIDMKDKRERESHREVGGVVQDITSPYLVGGSLMQYPKDMTYDPDPEQVVNCRCSIEYF